LPREIQNYLGQISGPLLDRTDLHVELPSMKFREITDGRSGETSAQIGEPGVAERRKHQQRFAFKSKITRNASKGGKELEVSLCFTA